MPTVLAVFPAYIGNNSKVASGIIGSLSSSEPDCLPKRRIYVENNPADGSAPIPFEKAISSRLGAVFARGFVDYSSIRETSFTLREARVHIGERTIICGGVEFIMPNVLLPPSGNMSSPAVARNNEARDIETLGMWGIYPDSFLIPGFIESEKDRCVSGRKVIMRSLEGGVAGRVIEVGYSGSNGGFALKGPEERRIRVLYKMPARTLPPREGGITCEADSFEAWIVS